jgi:hypothetical protein
MEATRRTVQSQVRAPQEQDFEINYNLIVERQRVLANEIVDQRQEDAHLKSEVELKSMQSAVEHQHSRSLPASY